MLPAFLMSEVQHPNHSSWQRSFLCWLFVIIRIFPTGLKKDMIGIISLTLNTDTRFGAILVRNQFLDGGIPSVYNPKLYNSKPNNFFMCLFVSVWKRRLHCIISRFVVHVFCQNVVYTLSICCWKFVCILFIVLLCRVILHPFWRYSKKNTNTY